jgi:Skp family chaperone for outer membrane proteins
MEQGLRTKLLTALTLVLVFASGGVTGYAAAAREGDAAEPLPPARRSYVFEQFSRTEVQQVQIDSILRTHRAGMNKINSELEQLRQRYQAASDSISRATGDAIALVFPADVSEEYRARLAESRSERARSREEMERAPRGDPR